MGSLSRRLFRRLALAATSLAALGVSLPGQAATVFSLVNTFQVTASSGNGLDSVVQVGNQWFGGNIGNGFYRYDQNFQLLGSQAIAGFSGLARGMAYNSSAGQLYVASIDGRILTVGQDGALLSSVASGIPTLVGLALNPGNGNLWAMGFGGLVKEFSPGSWQMLRSFTVPSAASGGVTGLAYDSWRDTLLVMGSSYDELNEYSTSGAALGTAIASDMVSNNGLGLFFQPSTGFLYAGAQNGSVAVWQRDVPLAVRAVAEPGGLALLAVALSAAMVAAGARQRAGKRLSPGRRTPDKA